MYVMDAYEERKFQETQEATWGHLAPTENQTYLGYFTYATGCYGGCGYEITSSNFEGLDDSPWYYDALIDYVNQQDIESGMVYQFVGSFCNGVFEGIITIILDTNVKKEGV